MDTPNHQEHIHSQSETEIETPEPEVVDVEEEQYEEPDFENRGFHNVLEKLLTYTFPFLSIFTFWYIFQRMEWGPQYLILIPGFFIGYLIADLITGMVHWFADTYGSIETPIFGANFIEPFRWHHIDPKAMCKHSLPGTMGDSCFLSHPAQTLIILIFYYTEPNFWITAACLTLNIAVVATVFANLFHKWVHYSPEERPRIAVFLQKYRLILEPEHHNIHHASPFETYYCVTNGWMNWFLHKINWWRNLERFLSLFGWHPDPSSKVSPKNAKKFSTEAKQKI